jgi:hypothetical protein
MRQAEIAITGALNFTEPERDYIERVARDRHGVAGRVGFYAAALTIAGALVAIFIVGCATQPASNKNLLLFLSDGSPTCADVEGQLGAPSRRYDHDRIMSYRIGERPDNAYFVAHRRRHGRMRLTVSWLFATNTVQ